MTVQVFNLVHDRLNEEMELPVLPELFFHISDRIISHLEKVLPTPLQHTFPFTKLKASVSTHVNALNDIVNDTYGFGVNHRLMRRYQINIQSIIALTSDGRLFGDDEGTFTFDLEPDSLYKIEYVILVRFLGLAIDSFTKAIRNYKSLAPQKLASADRFIARVNNDFRELSNQIGNSGSVTRSPRWEFTSVVIKADISSYVNRYTYDPTQFPSLRW